ncbi:MAG: hypothetical protein HWE39_04075 [Oceanospirillaceae bacterium]|nr:hypothetical protein [Oceanospirillaceae bacterium]
MKALLYSLTLLLFSLSVEAADRSQATAAVQQVGLEAMMLQSVPEPVLPGGIDGNALPVSATSTAIVYRAAPESALPRACRRQTPLFSPIRAPPYALS